jgi:signal transduction histidine kinase
MIAEIRIYRAPLFFAILAMAGLAWWSYSERRNLDQIRNQRQHQIVTGLFNIADKMIAEVSQDDAFQNTHLMDVLEILIVTSQLEFITLERDGRCVFQTSAAPTSLSMPSEEGESFDGSRFLFWRKVRGLKGKAWAEKIRQSAKPGETSKRTIEESSWVLIVGGEFFEDKREYAAALHRMYFTHALAFLFVAASIVAWIVMIRGRLISERLRIERLHQSHMEELELSAAGLAHETKNPLGIISGIAQQIAQDPATNKGNRMKLEQIIDEVDKAASRLGHFLAFARQQTINLSTREAQDVIGKICAVLNSEFVAAGVELAWDCPPFQISCDEDALKQILVNLLLNSLHASSEGGHIMLRMVRRGRLAELVVADRGSGIAPELLPKIFRPYVTGYPDGHGLGLAIVKRYVDEHGWTVKVESVVDRGTTVTISGIVIVSAQGYAG